MPLKTKVKRGFQRRRVSIACNEISLNQNATNRLLRSETGTGFRNFGDMEVQTKGDHQSHQGLPTRQDGHTCEDCGKKFSRAQNLRDHRRIHTKQKFTCTIDGCERSFISKSNRRTHLLEGHGSKKISNLEKPVKKFRCLQEGCNRSYEALGHLTRHENNHKNKQIKCLFPGCIRTFVRQDLLNAHTQRHENKRAPIPEKVSEHHGVQKSATRGVKRSNSWTTRDGTLVNFNKYLKSSSSETGLVVFSNGHSLSSVKEHKPEPIPAMKICVSDCMIPQSLVISDHPTTSTSLPETMLSEVKSQEIMDFVKERFRDTENVTPIRALLMTDCRNNSHSLSWKMMQKYINIYWSSFSSQIPILHKPTFSPDKTPNLLLIAMMILGASLKGETHGHKAVQAGPEISEFLAWNLRGEILRDHGCSTKVWVIQALLLLEVYEKMCSTRHLHERAHVHHATPLTLIWRSGALVGGSTPSFPPKSEDNKQSLDEKWKQWAMNEAARRTVFAALVIDSTHSAMFGHSTVMPTHEIELPLPCDEALWSATDSAEASRIQTVLDAQSVKPIFFLKGLMNTLNGQEMRTSSFGRTILIAGCLNFSWHMNHYDLQVVFPSIRQACDQRERWRVILAQAFDQWNQGFDKSRAALSDEVPALDVNTNEQEHGLISQHKTVLYHLAHMSMHVDIVMCQMFARAPRLIGRALREKDFTNSQRDMKIWAPSEEARKATLHAFQFLSSVLLPAGTPMGAICDEDSPFGYSAREDVLLDRPWVLYFAALIVWSYGYAREGPIHSPVPATDDFSGQVRDMQAYLRRFSGIQSPEQLQQMTGFNGCSGMLMVLCTVFEGARWELLHEASWLLRRCLQQLNTQRVTD